jgi:hypothetical protein
MPALALESRLFMSGAHHRILVFASNVFAAERHTRWQQGLAIARVPSKNKESDITRSQDNLANPSAADFCRLALHMAAFDPKRTSPLPVYWTKQIRCPVVSSGGQSETARVPHVC